MDSFTAFLQTFPSALNRRNMALPQIEAYNGSIDHTVLESPQIETLEIKEKPAWSRDRRQTLENLDEREEDEQLPLQTAKEKFQNAAFKLMTRLASHGGQEMQNSTSDSKPETPDSSKDPLSRQGGSVKSVLKSNTKWPRKAAPRSKLSVTVTSPSARRRRESTGDATDGETGQRRSSVSNLGGRQMTFMSLVRLAKFRRRLSRSQGRHGDASSGRESVTEDDVFDRHQDLSTVSSKPRFCATLSPEAQYATLKCYEDVLVQNLQSRPLQTLDCRQLLKVRTPHRNLKALHLTDVSNSDERENDNEVDDTDDMQIYSLNQSGSRQDRPETGVSRSSVSSYTAPYSRTQTDNHYPGINRIQSTPASAASRKSGTIQIMNSRRCSSLPATPRIPTDIQTRLSCKFQKAMDILDEVNSQEKPRRFPRINANPVASYNIWSQAWAKEFRFEYNRQHLRERVGSVNE